MRKFHAVIFGAALVMGVTGCDAEPQPSAALRCANAAGAGIVGLDTVTISGNVSLLGEDASAIHGNNGVSLSGSLYVESDILSGGSVTKNGNSMDLRGSVRENVAHVSAEPDFGGADRAEADNENAQLRVGSKSPIKNGQLRLTGRDSLSMPAGDYYFASGMAVSGQSKILLEGDVRIFVAGSVSITGTTYTNDAADARMEIISVSDDSIRLSGTADANLHISAPLAEVALSGTSAFGGTILGNTVKISGTADLGIAGNALWYDGGCEDPDPEPEPEPETDPELPDLPPPDDGHGE